MDGGFNRDPLETALNSELLRDERLLWKGRAIARINRSAFRIWLFAVPWTAFAVFWTLMAGLFSAFAGVGEPSVMDWAFPLFGVPFILVGLGMMAAPFLGVGRARKTIFAITDQRVLRLLAGRTRHVQSVPFARIGELERSEGRDGSGSLTIRLSGASGENENAPGNSFVLGEVQNVRAAETRLREMVERARRLSSSASTRS